MHPKTQFITPRPLTTEEQSWFNKLFSVHFNSRDILVDQIKTCRVIGFCSCGCKSIMLEVDHTLPKYTEEKRIPVEMQLVSEDEAPIIFLLHVQDGYVSELEIYSADSHALYGSFDLQTATVYPN